MVTELKIRETKFDLNPPLTPVVEGERERRLRIRVIKEDGERRRCIGGVAGEGGREKECWRGVKYRRAESSKTKRERVIYI